MSKMKEVILEVLELNEDGYTASQISDQTGTSLAMVCEILKQYNWMQDEDETLVQ
jgi:uncharacterized protein YerC